MDKTKTTKKFKLALLLLTLLNLAIVLTPIFLDETTSEIMCYVAAIWLTVIILIIEIARVKLAVKEWVNTPGFNMKDVNWKESPKTDKGFIAINIFLILLLFVDIFIRL